MSGQTLGYFYMCLAILNRRIAEDHITAFYYCPIITRRAGLHNLVAGHRAVAIVVRRYDHIVHSIIICDVGLMVVLLLNLIYIWMICIVLIKFSSKTKVYVSGSIICCLNNTAIRFRQFKCKLLVTQICTVIQQFLGRERYAACRFISIRKTNLRLSILKFRTEYTGFTIIGYVYFNSYIMCIIVDSLINTVFCFLGNILTYCISMISQNCACILR